MNTQGQLTSEPADAEAPPVDLPAAADPRPFGLSRLMALGQSFAGRMELDRAVSYAVLTRLWSFIAGPISAIVIATRFTQVVQGYYYTFGSLVALQTFAELGIGVAITQFASHEWSSLHIGAGGRIEGDETALSRLASLTRIAVKWYAVVGLVMVVGLSTAGYLFFLSSPQPGVHWQWPWIALCALSGVDLCSIAIWSLLEGCNQVSNVYRYRLLQGVLSSLVVWIAICSGAGLWTAAIMTAVNLMYAARFMWKYYRAFLRTLLEIRPHGPRVGWRSEILPFQWRIAVSWASGYFIFSLFVPVLFHYRGAVIAGQMGMTWSLVSVISSVGSAWISPRVPQFGMLIAQKKFRELDRLFWRLTEIVTGVAVLGAISTWALVVALNHFHSRFAVRLLPPLPTTLFLLATVVYTAYGPMPVYLRAHKREPLLAVSVVLAVIVGLATWLLGSRYGAVGVGAGYLAAQVMILPVIAAIWRRCRSAWHADPMQPSEG